MSKEGLADLKLYGGITAAGITIAAVGFIDNAVDGTFQRINQAYDKARSEVAAENITRPKTEDEKKAAAIIREAARKLDRDRDNGPLDTAGAITIVDQLPNALRIEAQEQIHNKAVSDHADKYIDQDTRRHEIGDWAALSVGGLLAATGIVTGAMAPLARLASRRRSIPQTPQGK
jgi:hypothetical protein